MPSEEGPEEGPAHPEEGMVTVETAIALGATVMVLLALLLALAVGSAKTQVCHAVGVGARAHSLGSDAAQAASAASGGTVQISVAPQGEWFTVTGRRGAMRLGQWSVGEVRCEVRGIREPTWATILQGGSG